MRDGGPWAGIWKRLGLPVAAILALGAASGVHAQQASDLFSGLERHGAAAAPAPNQAPRWLMEGALPDSPDNGFQPLLDTPCFSNFVGVGDRLMAFTGGYCYGINLLVADWFYTVTEPLSRDREGAVLTGLTKDLGIDEAVAKSDLARFRLNAYSRDSRHEANLRKQIALRHKAQAFAGNRGSFGDASRIFAELASDLRDSGRGLALLGLYPPEHSWGHSILAYRLMKGIAVSDDGRREPAYQILVSDPNRQADQVDPAKLYVLYLPSKQRFVLPACYLPYLQQPEEAVQEQEFLASNQVKFEPLNELWSRVVRSVRFYFGRDSAQQEQPDAIRPAVPDFGRSGGPAPSNPQ